jgi:SAM-dependent methyltransferase
MSGHFHLMNTEPLDLEQIANKTLAYYDQRADDFWTGTRDHDVSQNIKALLDNIQGTPQFTILDFGCGPGRDLKTFADLGHVAIGLEGSTRFVEMARTQGFDVWQQNFLALDLPEEKFDGIFANASLFHVPSQELPEVLSELCASLKPGGILFSSNPRGDNSEGWNRGRYGAYWDLTTWRGFLLDASFEELGHYYRPAGLPRDQQPWLAIVWRKSDARRRE